MKFTRFFAGTAVLALTSLGLGAAPLPIPAEAAPAQEQPSASSEKKSEQSQKETAREGVTITGITPWLDDKGELTISGEVRTGDQPLKNPVLNLGMSTRVLNSTDAVTAWDEKPNPHRTLTTIAPDFKPAKGKDPITADALPSTIDAKTTAQFSVTIPAAKLGLGRKDPLRTWGARGVRVTVGTEDGTVYGSPATAFTTWYPKPKIEPTELGVIIPATITRFGVDGEYAATDLNEAASGGELSDLLKAMKDAPDAAVALDPRLVMSISDALKPPPEDDATEAPGGGEDTTDLSALSKFWDDFKGELKKHDIIPLPYADADLRSVRSIGESRLADAAQASARQITDEIPELRDSGKILRYSWPAAGGADRSTLESLHSAGHDALLLSEDQLPAAAGYTSNARAQIATDDLGSTIPVLVTNSDLDSSIGSAPPKADDDREEGERSGSRGISEDPTAPRTAEDMSRTVAMTAAITSERPFDQRSVLMSLPRHAAEDDWSQLASMPKDLPWLNPAGLPDLEKADPSEREPFQPAQRPVLPSEHLSPLSKAYDNIGTFDSLFTDPEEARIADTRMLLTCTSIGWSRRTDELSDCVSTASKAAEGFGGRIGIERGSTVLLVTGESTTIPITVHNNSNRPAEFSLSLRPQTAQMRAEKSSAQKIGPGEHTRFSVPVEGIANADVTSRVDLVAADGTIIPTDEEILVRVRADWENIGIAVGGGALAIVFVVGLYFSVRRGRPKIPKSQLEAAVARAEQGED